MADPPPARSPTAQPSPYDWDLLDFPKNELLESHLHGSASLHLGGSGVLVPEHGASDSSLLEELAFQHQDVPSSRTSGIRLAGGLVPHRPAGSNLTDLNLTSVLKGSLEPCGGSLAIDKANRDGSTAIHSGSEALRHPAGLPRPPSRLSQSTPRSGRAEFKGDMSWLMPEQSWIDLKEHGHLAQQPLFIRVSSCPENLMEDPPAMGAARLPLGMKGSALGLPAGSARHKMPPGSVANSLLHGQSLPFSSLAQLAVPGRVRSPGAEAAGFDPGADLIMERRIKRALADDDNDPDGLFMEEGLDDDDEFADLEDLEEEEWLGSWPDYSTLGLVPPQVLRVEPGPDPSSKSNDAAARDGVPSNQVGDAGRGAEAHSKLEKSLGVGPHPDTHGSLLARAREGRETSVGNIAGIGTASRGVADEWELVEAEAVASLSHFERHLGTWVLDLAPAPVGLNADNSAATDHTASPGSSQPGPSPYGLNHSALVREISGSLGGASTHSAGSTAKGRSPEGSNPGSMFGSGGWTLGASFAVRVPLWSSAVVFALLGAGIAFLASWGWEQRGRHLELKQALVGARERCTELADKVRCLEVLLSHVNRAAALVPVAPATPVRIVHVPF